MLAFRLVLMLAVMDLGSCIAGFIGNPPTGSAACTAQGMMMQYFETSGFLWTSVIAFVLDRIVRRDLFWLEIKGQLILFGFALGVPVLFALLPFSWTIEGSEAYANAGAWCFISTNNERTPKMHGGFNVGTMWRFLLFYCPLWLCMLYNLAAYGRIIRILRASLGSQRSTENEQEVKKKEVKKDQLINRLRLYPIILVVCWTFGSINRIQNAVHPGYSERGLLIEYKMRCILGTVREGY
jgi:hypothetical protein